MKLNDNQTSFLRKRGHPLKPVVRIGNNGLSEAVLKELDLTLEHHELIKVRIPALDKAAREALTEELCSRSGAALVQQIGHIALIYRPSAKMPKIVIPG